MNRQVLYFSGPRKVEIRSEALRALADKEVLVRTLLSGVSAGTEMLLFRGEVPSRAGSDVDEISQGLAYPVPYGYCSVGEVTELGPAADGAWLGRIVFGFQAHASHYIASTDSLMELPTGVTPEDGVFLPNAETAVNLVQDAAPVLGERVLVLGQGVVGLCAASLLHAFPLECLVTVDRYEIRREASRAIGVTSALDPDVADFRTQALSATDARREGFDISVELTGNPAALDEALALTMFGGRVVVGSWFGTKPVKLDLGGRFHRSRIELTASQVSTVAAKLSARWDKQRRFSTAWEGLRRVQPSKWITHRFPLSDAAEAYGLLDESPEAAIQIVFEYS